MKHLAQTRLNNCGQTCVAIIEGVSIDTVEAVMHKTGCTRPVELRRVLTRMGWGVTRSRFDKHWPLLKRGVLMVHGEKRGKHLVVKRGNWILDPGLPKPIRFRPWLELLATREGGWHVTSYFKVWGK